ncbi:hypothetical protein [Halpernia frigidisoli]|uniref:Uncharacterized protein n=1 Tax=Halpernia frigidisoli TaxID=1125876 RepID=A0A1I3DQC8_9FLAO|nr:hypothetical protein [Halpernia frigidisoli]SFH88940.1 hypothetical protein SAMN05443292_0638 [Halpernia frigidisoli]
MENVAYGEGYIADKFFKSVGQEIAIFPKEVTKNISKQNIKPHFENNDLATTKKIFKILFILIFCFIIYHYSSNKRESSNHGENSSVTNVNNYITKAGYKASYDENTLEKLVKFSVHNDLNGINFLTNTNEIFDLQSGQEAYVLESKFGRVKIRLINSGEEVWTFTEAISD